MSYVDTVREVQQAWSDYDKIKHEELIEPFELAYVKLKNQIFKFIEGQKDIDKKLQKFINKCHKIDLQLKITQLKKKKNKKSYYKV